MKTKSQVIKILKKTFPNISGIKDANDFDDSESGGIHLGDCAEGGMINGIPACDYNAYEHDPQENTYISGVNRDLIEVLQELGWFAECYDPGTYIAYRI